MWRARLTRTLNWIRSRKLVGEDEHHMFYTEFIAKDTPERRYVEYKDRDITHSSDRMPIEWWSWLHNRRDEIPTTAEIASSAQNKHRLAERVAILEAEDERQRLRQFAGSPSSTRRSAADDEVHARRKKKALLGLVDAAAPSRQSLSDLENASPVKFGGDGHSLNPEENPKGSGEDFQPGSWKPAQSRRRGR